MTSIDLRKIGATEMILRSEASTQDGYLEEILQRKLVNYYTLLDLFSKVQSSRTPHAIVLEGFTTFLDRGLHTDVDHTAWLDKTDLMGPFTNYLPQRNLITMTIVSFFHEIKNSRWFGVIIDKIPNCLRRHIEHDDWDGAWFFPTERISKWFSELVVILAPTIVVAPMFALYAIPSIWERMAGLWVFAILFAIMTRLLTSASSDFIFASNAAFCAVLVVFVGIALPE